MQPNPFESPRSDVEPSNTVRQPTASRRALAFLFCLFMGVATSQLLAARFGFSDGPDGFLLLGVFGVILGGLGGFFANLYCANRMPWYFVVVGFGILLWWLISFQSPSYSYAAKLIAVVVLIQMLSVLGVGYFLR